MWAAWNVGAHNETEVGNFYQYGKGAKTYQQSVSEQNYSGTENPLSSSVDTATQVMGENCSMPTVEQLEELFNETEWDQMTDYLGSGVNGYLFSKNGKSIFIPFAGAYFENVHEDENETFYVWSSEPDGAGDAYFMTYDGEDIIVRSRERLYGQSIRAVKNPQ